MTHIKEGLYQSIIIVYTKANYIMRQLVWHHVSLTIHYLHTGQLPYQLHSNSKCNVQLKSPPILLCMNIQPSGACLETVGCLDLSSYIIYAYVWICHLVMYVCSLHTDRCALSNITFIIMLNAKRVNPKHTIHYLLQS